MPNRKSPYKLQEISVSIAGELLHKLNEKKTNTIESWPSGMQSPFLCCPNSVIQDIINYLGIYMKKETENVIHKHIMQLLLCRNFDNLDLTPIRVDENELAELLELILPSAPNLQTFQLFAAGFGTETKDQFFELISRTNVAPIITTLTQNLTRITQLCLYNLCYDDILAIIGENCPHLVVLKVMSEHITDVGLINLCTNGKKPSIPEFKLQCQKLQQISLDPRAEGITRDGIHALLTNLPNLKIIEGCIVGCILEEVYGSQDSVSYSKVEYKLTHYMYDWRRAQSSGVVGMRIALQTCPLITNLKLLEPTDEALIQLGTLRFLTSVTVISYTNQTSFETGVLPFLQQAGQNLIKLSLSLGKIDLASMDWACPKLEFLDCSNVRQIYSTSEYSKMPFANLRDLVFHANLRTTLNAETLKIILSWCFELESLYISYCNSLTDLVLDAILHINPLRKLKSLHLMYVERITADAIESLVLRESDLQKLWLFNVSGNHKATLKHVKEMVEQMNLDLEIDLIVQDKKLSEFDLNLNCQYYLIQKLPVFQLIKQEFIEAFIKRGKLYLMSEDTRSDIDDSLQILPTNELILQISKDTYQELGIQGKPVILGKSKNPQSFIIKLDLTSNCFIPGKHNYDRVFERFNARKDLKFNCLAVWEPNDKKVCSSSIAKYFETHLQLNVKLCNVKEETNSKISNAIPELYSNELNNYEHIFDWIGFITNDFQNASNDSFVTEFLPDLPLCKERKMFNCVQWRGFFPQDVLKSFFNTLKTKTIEETNWLIIVVHGFEDIYSLKYLKEECNYYKNGNNFVCFVMFADKSHWKFVPIGGNKIY